MRNNNFWAGFGVAVYTLVALVAISISVITFQHQNMDHTNPFFSFLVIHHLWIMLITMIVSIGYGFAWAMILLRQVKKEETTTKDMLSVVLAFMGADERLVLTHLLEHDGKSTQAAISRIEKMGAVKALRTVQKMEEKQLVSIQKEGKVRHVTLKSSIYEQLKGQNQSV